MSGAVLAARAIQSDEEPDPFANVTVTDAPPATLFELTASVGGCVMLNGRGADTPPPGAGLKTVTCAVPMLAMSLVEIAARTCVEFTNVVARSLPFHRTTEPVTKLLPLTVNMNGAAPADIVAGEIEETTGAGGNTVIAGLVARRV